MTSIAYSISIPLALFIIRKLRLRRFTRKTIDTIIRVRDAIKENPSTNQSFITDDSSRVDIEERHLDMPSRHIYRIILKNPKDYIILHDLFNALSKREKELNTSKLNAHNDTCLELAEKALDIDWKKYS